MRHVSILLTVTVCNIISFCALAQTGNADIPANSEQGKQLFIDVHYFEPGKINFKDVAGAHAKDLAIENKYGVEFLKYWVDEKNGLVYCLSSAPDSASIMNTHLDAHGLLPSEIHQVTSGTQAAIKGKNDFYLDIHQLGAGNVTAKDVAGAHQKDLAVQGKYGVNFINYWVDEKAGVVLCLSQASDSTSVIKTHKEAHGLLPMKVIQVKQGQ